MIVTPLYAAIIALLFVYLSTRVIGGRRRFKVGLGDGDNTLLRRRIRAHGNCAEYAPLTLLLMGLAELQGADHWALHLLGVVLLAGRGVHAAGLSREPEPRAQRVIGMVLTLNAILFGASLNLIVLDWGRLL